jgi:hypothetical protein
MIDSMTDLTSSINNHDTDGLEEFVLATPNPKSKVNLIESNLIHFSNYFVRFRNIFRYSNIQDVIRLNYCVKNRPKNENTLQKLMMFDCHVRFCHIITINKESFNIF